MLAIALQSYPSGVYVTVPKRDLKGPTAIRRIGLTDATTLVDAIARIRVELDGLEARLLHLNSVRPIPQDDTDSLIAQPERELPPTSQPKTCGIHGLQELRDDTIIDQRCGLVDRKQYLALARRGEFPSKKVGKRVFAQWRHVRAAFLGDPSDLAEWSGASSLPTAHDELDALRTKLGLVRKGR